jgi:hypothetical protein
MLQGEAEEKSGNGKRGQVEQQPEREKWPMTGFVEHGLELDPLPLD